eukprot:TRINITY_DN1447_c0_g1_i2.p1 TRINITY_DN1447_c0_g1~~TRINITY_DN1447_c0_g1_i2.p1  ORF type:complete len:163 (+),score=43.78 TRINITY_DN1447_c0_g1_i2:44-490(+)
MVNVGAIVGPIIGVLFLVIVVREIWRSVRLVKEKEVMVVERLGKFHSILNAGVHFLIPFVDRPKRYSQRYYAATVHGETQLIERLNMERISTQNEVLDFPKQNVITRDNASIYLDAVLSYKIVNPKQMIYSIQNLPDALSKLLQVLSL